MDKKATKQKRPALQPKQAGKPLQSINSQENGPLFNLLIDQCAFLQEFPMCEKTLRNHCAAGSIPHCYMGSGKLINRTELERQLPARQRGAANDDDNSAS